MISNRRVVITGLGSISPLGKTAEESWNNLVAGTSGCDFITYFDTEKFKTKFACEVKNYKPEDYFDRKEARRMDQYAQFAMIAAKEAINDSELLKHNPDPDRVGVIWGSGIGGLNTFQQEIGNYYNNNLTPRFSPFFIPKMIADIASGHISMKYNFRGPNLTTVSACASSTNAIIDALFYIKLGLADVIVGGGSEATITDVGIGGFSSMQALSKRNDDPKTASRPFDKDRDGFVMGEGGTALILEEYQHAKARGAKIYAELVGGGLSADAYHLTAPHPEGIGAKNVMKNALQSANIKPEDIGYINVHGTSTPLGDLSESLAIKDLFKDHAYKLNISSTKSMTGHLLGAAGAFEGFACIMALKTGVIPPTINHFTDDDKLDNRLNYTFNKAQKKDITFSLSNTFGFGGHNASVIFKKID